MFVAVMLFACCSRGGKSPKLTITKGDTAKHKAKGQKFCITNHRPPVPAQGGYKNYCKACFKNKFPRLYLAKLREREKVCSMCKQLEKELRKHDLCKGCLKAKGLFLDVLI